MNQRFRQLTENTDSELLTYTLQTPQKNQVARKLDLDFF